jgi:threonine aldolase
MNYAFASDNTAPAAPEIVASIAAVNHGAVLSYGADPWSDDLRDSVTAAFELPHPAGVVPILSGKLANHLALAAITEPGGVVFCHEHAHILIDENGGPEYVTRCRIIGLPGEGDKIAAGTLRAAIAREGTLPPTSAFTLTTGTEAGRVSTLTEMHELWATAHDAGLLVHLDGARFANAAAALGCSLAEITWQAGVDILSLGATKNGGLSAEAVVAFAPAVAERLTAKQQLLGHYPSKMRFLSAQLSAWLANDGWRTRAAHANARAQCLATAFREIPGIRFVQPVEANILFVTLAPERKARLDAAGFYVYDQPIFGEGVFRFVTNWATTDADLTALIAAIARE